MFKDVGEAYGVLSDPKLRRRYDSGADLEELNGGGAGFGGITIPPRPSCVYQYLTHITHTHTHTRCE